MPDAAPARKGQRLVALIVAISTGASTILGLYKGDKRAAVLGFVGMVFAAVLTLAIQKAIHEFGRPNATFYDVLVKVLVGFVVLYFMVFLIAIFPWILRVISDPSRLNIAGKWTDNERNEMECKISSTDDDMVTCAMDNAGYRHRLVGRYKSYDRITGSLSRTTLATKCVIKDSRFTITLHSDDRFQLAWIASSGDCDLPQGYPGNGMFTKFD